MNIDIELNWQEKHHLQQSAEDAGQSVERYLDGLLHDAILAEMLEQSRHSPTKPLEEIDFEGMKAKIREHALKRTAS